MEVGGEGAALERLFLYIFIFSRSGGNYPNMQKFSTATPTYKTSRTAHCTLVFTTRR